MKIFRLSVLVVLCAFAAQVALAQTVIDAPNMLNIYREEVKPGHRSAYAATAAAWIPVLRKAAFPQHYLALRSISGPNENWYLEGMDNFAALEANDAHVAKNASLAAEMDQLSANDGEHLASTRRVQAIFRPDLSYNAKWDRAKVRAFHILTTRVRPGHDEAYVDMMKRVKAAHEKVGIGERYGVYEVVGGMPSGTYLMFIALDSLKDADTMREAHEKQMPPGYSADDRAVMRKTAGDGILFTDSTYFTVDPNTSYVAAERIAADPAFWTPKVITAAAEPAKPAAGKKKLASKKE